MLIIVWKSFGEIRHIKHPNMMHHPDRCIVSKRPVNGVMCNAPQTHDDLVLFWMVKVGYIYLNTCCKCMWAATINMENRLKNAIFYVAYTNLAQ